MVDLSYYHHEPCPHEVLVCFAPTTANIEDIIDELIRRLSPIVMEAEKPWAL
jgi:hypothetical protein